MPSRPPARAERGGHRAQSRFLDQRRYAASGVAVITVPDNRWARVDIKAVALLPNVLAKQTAREQGAREAWFVDSDGRVTEGSSSNAWIVTADGKVVTRKADHAILRGITRDVLIEAIEGAGARLRGTGLHGRGGAGRARGVPDLGESGRDADRADRRPADRRRQARAWLPRRCGRSSGGMPR